MQLNNRKALITGGGTGIGRTLALRLADMGGAIALAGRRPEPLRETAALVAERGGVAHVITADLTAPAVPARLVEQSATALGGLDLLVNNAGNVRAGELESISEDDIQAMISVDLITPILLTRAALPTLKAAALAAGQAHGSAAIVGIAHVGIPYYSVYAAAKAGMSRFNEAIRREVHGTGIYVATAYPGAMATPMMDSSTADDDLGFGRHTVEEVVDAIIDGIRADQIDINAGSRKELHDLNRTNPRAVDERFAPLLPRLFEAVSGHRAI